MKKNIRLPRRENKQNNVSIAKNERCPVTIFKFLITKHPANLQATGPFYLAIISTSRSNIWFKKSPVDIHTKVKIMKTMVSSSPIQTSNKWLTNHSARKTLPSLKRNHLPRSEIISITGHNTEIGLESYDTSDKSQQQVISNTINNKTRKISFISYHVLLQKILEFQIKRVLF